MEEKKAWATSKTAKNMQAEFICLAYNLLLIFENILEKDEGIKNKKETKRKIKRLKNDFELSKIKEVVLPLHLQTLKRSTQRPLKFIRWLRNQIFTQSSWSVAIKALRLVYDEF